MTDLLRVLPQFPIGQYASLIPALEKHQLSTSDVLTLDPVEIGKITHLPLLDVKRLCRAITDALRQDLGVSASPTRQEPQEDKDGRILGEADGADGASEAAITGSTVRPGQLRHSVAQLSSQWSTISTLDATLDRALGGGIPTGYVTEITGESGAGKTQFLLSLLLAVQLPPPHGISRPALYISTEARLSTRRLAQMLAANPLLRSSSVSLDKIMSTTTADLESQDHILTFQVPVEVERRNIGLVVLDSVAANYRAEFERAADGTNRSNMVTRGAELVRLGMQLHELARRHNLAVVVANQVADRFGESTPLPRPPLQSHRGLQNPQGGGAVNMPMPSQESPLASRSRVPVSASVPLVEPTSSIADLVPRSSVSSPPAMPPPPPPPGPPPWPSSADDLALPSAPPALLLDHQQRWFTGWGDDPASDLAPKTPSLGLVWSTQVACRIALLRRETYGRGRVSAHGGGDHGGGTAVVDEYDGAPALPQTWRRWMKVVFAPHVAASGPGVERAVEFEVTMGGLRAVRKEGKKRRAEE